MRSICLSFFILTAVRISYPIFSTVSEKNVLSRTIKGSLTQRSAEIFKDSK